MNGQFPQNCAIVQIIGACVEKSIEVDFTFCRFRKSCEGLRFTNAVFSSNPNIRLFMDQPISSRSVMLCDSKVAECNACRGPTVIKTCWECMTWMSLGMTEAGYCLSCER